MSPISADSTKDEKNYEEKLEARRITPEILETFDKWTREADMFKHVRSLEVFGEELRAVFVLARKYLEEHPDNSIVFVDGYWWFYDETGAHKYGPYFTKSNAEYNMGIYKEILNTGKSELKFSFTDKQNLAGKV